MPPKLRLLSAIFAATLPLILALLAVARFSSVQAAPQSIKLSDPDVACRSCHREIFDRYRRTPMAQGSGLAVDGLDASELAAPDLVHRASGVTYHVALRDGQPYLAYDRPANLAPGALHGEHRLSLFVGSGHRGRTYLYSEDGLWFEAPINWYGKKQLWDMAPAFDDARTMPDPLPVDPNCLHCHAGDVQPASGPARNRFAAQPFRAGGIGCAACHGDPAAHLAQTKAQPHPTSSTILNPAHLDAPRRDSICLQCHLEGDAAVYLPGKSLQAFKPGQDLSASVTYFIDSSRAELGNRASSQYEALLRSACKRAAGDRLTCTTCHDPHGSPAPSERVAFFRARCLSCHNTPAIAVQHHPEQQDCALCHMPTRNATDISHEQLTDHNIQARHPAPLPEPARRSPAKLIPVGASTPSDRELGLAYAQLAQRGDRAAARQALTLLARSEHTGGKDSEVLDQLAFLLQVTGSPAAAAQRYLAALRQNPRDLLAAANLAVIDATTGESAEAIRLLTQVVHDDPSQTSAGLNLAFLQCRTGYRADALLTVQRMLQFNPDSTPARRFLETGSYGDQRCLLR